MNFGFIIQKPEYPLNWVTFEEQTEDSGTAHFFEIQHVQKHFIVPEKPFIKTTPANNGTLILHERFHHQS